METILFDLNYLGESSQDELSAYRNVGSVRTFRRLKAQERQRIRRRRLSVKAIKALLWSAVFAFDAWIFISWVDIVLHNTRPNPIYQVWNFFTLFS